MPVIIPLTAQDGLLLASLHKNCFSSGTGQKASHGWDQADFDLLLNKTSSCGWLAKTAAGTAAGFILASTVRPEAEIYTLAVVPEYQRQGIGLSLLKQLINFLKKNHFEKIFLEVAVDNLAAIGLYKSGGFTIMGRRPGYYQREGATFVDAYAMSCTI